MKNILVFLFCIFAFIFGSCVKKGDQAYIKVVPYIYNLHYDTIRLLLYENDGKEEEEITKEQLETKIFKPGTKVKIGVVVYNQGVELARSNDTNEDCKFGERTLEKGNNYMGIGLWSSCRIIDKEQKENNVAFNDNGQKENSGTSGGSTLEDQEQEILSCSISKESYSNCEFLEKIESNNSFYSKAISQLSGCSNYSEVICYYEKQGLVYLVCSEQKDIEGKDTFCLQQDNKLQFGTKRYSALKIGVSSIL